CPSSITGHSATPPIHSHHRPPELAYISGDCEARALIASPKAARVVAEACASIDFPASGRFVAAPTADVPGFRSVDELKRGQPTTLPANRTAGASMTYTSGTTGKPKGVRRPLPPAPPELVATQQALFLALSGVMAGSPGVHMVGAPLYHPAVLNFATNPLHLGHPLVLVDKWEPEAMLELVERYKITSSHMVPTQFNRLLKLPDDVRAKYDVSSLSHVIHSAAPCPVDTKKRMLAWWGPCIYEYYAASEGGGTACTPKEWLSKPGTVGKPWPIS